MSDSEKKSVDGKTVENTATEKKAADKDPAENKAAENKSVENKAAENKPVDNKSAENKAADNKSAENKPADNKPAESKPAESKPADKKPAESKPADKKSAESKPADKKPAESKPADKNPAGNAGAKPAPKPAANKPEGLNPEAAYAKAQQFLLADDKITDKSFRPDNFKTAAKYFKQAGDYKDAKKKAEECLKAAEEAREAYVEDYYIEGKRLMDTAKTPDEYETARRQFAKVAGYKDADALAKQCDEKQEALYMRRAKRVRFKVILFAAAIVLIIAFVKSPLWHRMMGDRFSGNQASEDNIPDSEKHGNGNYFEPAEAEPGDKVTFGLYDWRVLEREDDSLLLLMSGAEKHEETRGRAYNDTLEDTTWADCTLRAWLNGEFLENGFSEEEREKILPQECVNPDNKVYGTEGGEDTEDKVTLLTGDMYEQYLELIKTISMNFWIREPGYTQQNAQFVSHRREVMPYGYGVDCDRFYVIPMIKISVK